jgi:hypothetical protein
MGAKFLKGNPRQDNQRGKYKFRLNIKNVRECHIPCFGSQFWISARKTGQISNWQINHNKRSSTTMAFLRCTAHHGVQTHEGIFAEKTGEYICKLGIQRNWRLSDATVPFSATLGNLRNVHSFPFCVVVRCGRF